MQTVVLSRRMYRLLECQLTSPRRLSAAQVAQNISVGLLEETSVVPSLDVVIVQAAICKILGSIIVMMTNMRRKRLEQ